MKLEVGMYVRFKDLTNYIKNNDVMIDKITFISEVMSGLDETLQIELEKYQEPILKKDIIKASHNIIDLIEVGDYVNGHQVYEVDRECYRITLNGGDIGKEFRFTYLRPALGKNMGIKTIMTKEQFENNCFRIGDE